MRFRIIYDYIVTAYERFDGRLASLITIIQKKRVFFLHEICQLRLQQFVLGGLA